MFKNLFFHKNNNNIYEGTKESASPIREAHTLPTQNDARSIDRQKAKIKQLEREAKNNRSIRFYMYGK